jgi:alkylation response protein AidB-like acyl-CoA dehydrogenase
MADFQAAKLAVNRLTAAAVDRALTLCGGRGYGGDQPIGRLVRDVRAGPFMQPFSPHEALGYIGAVVAGVEPDVEA